MNISIAVSLLLSALFFCASWNTIAHLPPWNGFYSEALAVASLLALVLSFLLKGHAFKAGKVLVVFVFVFLGHAFFQYATGRVYFRSAILLYGYYGALVWLTFWLGQACKNEKKYLTGVLSIILLASLISAVFAMAHWLGQGTSGIFTHLIDDQTFAFREQGNIMQPNHLGTMCIMGVVAAVILWRRMKWTTQSLLPVVFLLSLSAGLTASRAILVNLFFLSGLAFFLLEKGERRKSSTLLVFSLCVCLAVMLVAPLVFEGMHLGIVGAESFEEKKMGSPTRLILYKHGLDAILLKPWAGFGWRQIAGSQILVSPNNPGVEATIYYHNIVLDALVENGVLFTVLYSVLMIVGLMRFRLRDDKHCLLLAATIVVPSLLEYQYTYTYLIIPSVFFASVSLDLKNIYKNHVFSKTQSWGFFVLISCFSFVVLMDYMKCEKAFVSSRLRMNGIYGNGASVSVPDVLVLDDLSYLASIAIFDKKIYLRNDLELLKYLSARYPYIMIKHYYIRALIQFGEQEKARVVYKGVMNCYSKNAKTYLNKMIEKDNNLFIFSSLQAGFS